MVTNEGWQEKKNILIILAHPDDPEFFLGATIARWISKGHKVSYVLLTKGDKGAEDVTLQKEEVKRIRVEEQAAAAAHLGVLSVEYLDYDDGYLMPDLVMRKEIVRCIRKYKPQILVTCDPSNLFPSQQYINHPDHRYTGQVVLDAVFPAAGNRFFFPELMKEGYLPHEVEEVWMSLTTEPDVELDVTDFWEDKLAALLQHQSQIGDPDAFIKRMRTRFESQDAGIKKYIERFRRIIFRRSTT
jgi:LmbE family N-acetylglucosaminyl deacetylase